MKPASTVGVMHVVDTLDVGGTETVALNLSNRLPRDRYRPYLCTTRHFQRENTLLTELNRDVPQLHLDRKFRFDFDAVARLRNFIRKEDIQLLHLHSTSLFLGRIATLFAPPSVRIIWHDHYGRCELNDRPLGLYHLAAAGADGVIAVNQQLADWATRKLQLSPRRVWYVPNFVTPQSASSDSSRTLP